MLLHRLQQRRLRFGRGAVDLVGEDDVAEDGSRLELEGGVSVLVFYDDVGTRNVCGHQVGRELDTGEGQVENAAERSHEPRFADAGHALEQDVAACDHGDDGAFHDFLLPDHVASDLREDLFALFAELKNALLCYHR